MNKQGLNLLLTVFLAFVLTPAFAAQKGQCQVANTADAYVLALSWEPGFCSIKGRGKPECSSLNAGRYDASHFSLHGLWPNKGSCRHQQNRYGYCGRVKSQLSNFCRYPGLNLSAQVRAELGKVMPSEKYGTCLQRHEWWKHGTCTGMAEDRYFMTAIALIQQVNESSFVRHYITDNIGKRTNRQAFESAFDQAFGQGASSHLTLQCSNGYLVEMQLTLPNRLKVGDRLSTLLRLSGGRENGRGHCDGGFLIDAAG